MCQPVPILRGSCSLGWICKLDKQNEFPLQSTDCKQRRRGPNATGQLASSISSQTHTILTPGELTPLLMKRVFVMYNERKRQDFLLRFNTGRALSQCSANTLQIIHTQHLCKHSDTHITLGVHGKRGLKTLLLWSSIIFAGFLLMANGNVSSIPSIDVIDFKPLQYVRENTNAIRFFKMATSQKGPLH